MEFIVLLELKFYNLQKMDIDFIELEHRENVLKLMEICGLEMKEAYNLLADSQYNF